LPATRLIKEMFHLDAIIEFVPIDGETPG